jgi:hypothetical protein
MCADWRTGSISRGLRVGANGSPPTSRTSTYRATVLASTPASFAANQAHCVPSYASRTSMISLLDFVNTPPGTRGLATTPPVNKGVAVNIGPGDLVSADQDNPCPSAGTHLSAHRKDDVAALSQRAVSRSWRPPGSRPRCRRRSSGYRALDAVHTAAAWHQGDAGSPTMASCGARHLYEECRPEARSGCLRPRQPSILR